MRKILHLIPILFYISTIISAYASDTQTINKREYFQTVQKAIQQSKKSIHMVMYYVNLHNTKKQSQVKILLDALIEAKKRGVKVNVLLDKTYDWNDQDDWDDSNKNAVAFNYLKTKGVDVSYDDLSTVTHSKYLVIDSKDVITGSTNWTNGAFARNNETSLFINSEDLARDLIKDFESIKKLKDSSNSKVFKKILIPKYIALGSISDMVSKKEESAYTTFMYLLSKGNKEIVINYEEIIRFLGIPNKFKSKYRRRKVRIALNKLDSKYKLIKYLNKDNVKQDPRVILETLPTNISENNIPLSEAFWEYNWIHRLSLTAQFCYFMGLMEGGKNFKTFKITLKDLQKKYSLSKNAISYSMLELRRYNLIDIKYSKDKNSKSYKNFVNEYRLKELHDMSVFEKRVKSLYKRYKDDVVNKALDYAHIIYCDYNIYEIKEIIEMINTYGDEKVNRAFNIVSKRLSNNPSRGMAYVKRIVENSVKDTQLR